MGTKIGRTNLGGNKSSKLQLQSPKTPLDINSVAKAATATPPDNMISQYIDKQGNRTQIVGNIYNNQSQRVINYYWSIEDELGNKEYYSTGSNNVLNFSDKTGEIGQYIISCRIESPQCLPSEYISGTYTALKYYINTSNITNGSWGISTQGIAVGETVSGVITPNENYGYPGDSDISVSGADKSYNSSTHVLSINNPTGTVSVQFACPPIMYNLNFTLTHCTISPSDVTQMQKGSSKTFTLTAPFGYQMPASITSPGNCDCQYIKNSDNTATLTLSNPTGNISVNIAATVIEYTVTFSIQNAQSIQSTVVTVENTAVNPLIVTVSPNTGYNIPASISSTNCIAAIDAAGRISIYNPTDNVSISGSCNIKTFNVTASVTPIGSGSYTINSSSSVNYGASKTITWRSNEGYNLPASESDFTVTGTHGGVSYNTSTHILTISNIQSDIAVVGTFTPIIPQYTVTFMNYEGSSTLYTATVEQGGTAIYSGSTPSKTGYTFQGWNSSPGQSAATSGILENIRNDKIVYAAFSINTYTVKFKDYYGSSTLYTDTVQYNGTASYSGTTPTMSGYIFRGWSALSRQSSPTSGILNNIQSNKDVYAAFELNQYTVFYMNQSGDSILQQKSGYVGSTVSYTGSTPAILNNTFTGWAALPNQSYPTLSKTGEITVGSSSTTTYASFVANNPASTSAGITDIYTYGEGVSTIAVLRWILDTYCGAAYQAASVSSPMTYITNLSNFTQQNSYSYYYHDSVNGANYWIMLVNSSGSWVTSSTLSYGDYTVAIRFSLDEFPSSYTALGFGIRRCLESSQSFDYVYWSVGSQTSPSSLINKRYNIVVED